MTRVSGVRLACAMMNVSTTHDASGIPHRRAHVNTSVSADTHTKPRRRAIKRTGPCPLATNSRRTNLGMQHDVAVV